MGRKAVAERDELRRAVFAIAALSATAVECREVLEVIGIDLATVATLRAHQPDPSVPQS